MSIPERCSHCGGNMCLEPLDYEAETGCDAFVGFECRCFQCGKWTHDYSVEELSLTWGLSRDQIEHMQWSDASFLFRRTATVATVRTALLQEVRDAA